MDFKILSILYYIEIPKMANYQFSIFYFIALFKIITFSQIKSPLHFVFLSNALFLYRQIVLNAKMKFPTCGCCCTWQNSSWVSGIDCQQNVRKEQKREVDFL